jgi:leucine dehydrogenase
MEELMRRWDGERVVMRYDARADAWMFVAIHSTRLGPASGGSRMRVYGSVRDGLSDAQRLAAGMTYKWAGVDFPVGGGKGVIVLSAPLSGADCERLLEGYGELVESLRGGFSTGADLGVGPELVRVIGRRTRYVFGLRDAGDPGPWTALGVFTGMQAAARQVFGEPELAGRTALIQGLGDVGLPLCELLIGAGATLKVSDVNVALAKEAAGRFHAEIVDTDAVYSESCDIFAPCAVGAILNQETIPKLRCRLVAGSANNQLRCDEDAERLRYRGILYCPDFIANAGGAIALCGIEAMGMGEEAIRKKVLSIGETLSRIFNDASQCGESPLRAAQRHVQRVLDRGPLAE